MKKILISMVLLFSNSPALAWHCNSKCEWYQPDCLAYIGWCNTFKGMADQLTEKIVSAIARDPAVINQAQRDGWTKTSCYIVGTPIFSLLIGIKSAPICAVLGAGAGTPACMGIVATLGTAISTGVCTQMCHDRHLLDPECQAN